MFFATSISVLPAANQICNDDSIGVFEDQNDKDELLKTFDHATHEIIAGKPLPVPFCMTANSFGRNALAYSQIKI